MKNRIWMKTYSDNENFNGDCDLAYVDMTPEVVDKILARRQLFLGAAAHDDSLWHMEFWSYTATWLGFGFPGSDEIEEAMGDEAFFIETDDCPFNVEVPGEGQVTECDVMGITKSDVQWNCQPKHSDVEVRSESLSYNLILAIASEQGRQEVR